MTIQGVIRHNKAKEIFLKNKWYPTNAPVDMELTDALRFKRIADFQFTQVPKSTYDPQFFKDKTFGFTGDADGASGFGNCTVNLIKYSVKDGYDVRWIGRNNQVPELSYLENKPLPLEMGMVYHEQPKDDWYMSPFGKNIAVVPFETTRIPQSWVGKINSFDAVFVPSQQNIQMMKDSGITVPIELIHWGIDETKWYPVERNNKVFTFGIMGALTNRKGIDILVKAFQLAFPINRVRDVKLIAKTSYNTYQWGTRSDNRIEVQMMPLDHVDLMENFVKRVDCFVFPSRGEGFGLPPLEMMATGIPAIMTGWGGLMEFYNPDCSIKLDYQMVPATSFSNDVYHEDCGEWTEPSLYDLVDKMQWCYSHQQEVKEMGSRAAEYVKKDWLWKDKIHMFHDALAKHL